MHRARIFWLILSSALILLVASTGCTGASETSVPTAPTGLSATASGNVVTIKLKAVSGATSYNIYSSAVPGVTTASKKTVIKNPPRYFPDLEVQTQLSGVSPGTYYFAMTAVNAKGESSLSEEGAVTVTGLAWAGHTTGPTNPNHLGWSGKLLVLGATRGIYSSADGVNWTLRSDWRCAAQDIVWSGSQFVSVGTSGRICTSPDGINWTQQTSGTKTSGTTVSLWGVTWSGSEFFAVGASSRILIFMRSPDGVNWIQQTFAYSTNSPSLHLADIAWSGTQYVAVGHDGGSNGLILTSSDGVNWVQQVVPGKTKTLSGIIWAGAQFVAVGGSILTSPDGINWTQQTVPSGVRRISWSGTRFVAVGGSKILVSSDGINWLEQSPIKGVYDLEDIIWTGTKFIAVGGNGDAGYALTSP